MMLGAELDRRHGRACAQNRLAAGDRAEARGLGVETARGKTKQKFSYPQAFENPRNGKIIQRRPGPAVRAAGAALKA
jgi:hypothetical protein